MRGVSTWASRVAPLLAVFLVLGAATAWADDAPAPTDPPQARLQPPGGVTTQARLQPPGGAPIGDDGTADARVSPPRVSPPVGATARLQPPVGGAARLNPPSGAPDQMSWMDMILLWLQSRLSIPNG